MKFSLALTAAAIAVSSTNAFTANLPKVSSTTTELAASNLDISDFIGETKKLAERFGWLPKEDAGEEGSDDPANKLIAEAMKMTKKYGATSTEARLAWEAVEEVNASDNTVASMGSLDDECSVEIVSEECLEYGDALNELQELIDANSGPDFEAVVAEELVGSVQPVKLAAPATGPGPASLELQKALEEARSVTASKGLTSPEATIAWETVEQIAAAGNTNALGGSLSSDECFVEAAREACAALEELNKIIGEDDRNN